MIRIPKCYSCKHFNTNKRSCSAFPMEIPSSILSGIHNHIFIRYNQQGNFVYEPNQISRNINIFEVEELSSEDLHILESKIKVELKELLLKINKLSSGEFTRAVGFETAYRNPMLKEHDYILCYQSNGKDELIGLGFNSNLFTSIRKLLNYKRSLDYTTDVKCIYNLVQDEAIVVCHSFNRKQSREENSDYYRAKHRLYDKKLLKRE